MADSANWDKPKLATAAAAVRRKKSQKASNVMVSRAHMRSSGSEDIDGSVARKQRFRGAQKNSSARKAVARARAGTLKQAVNKKK